MSTRTAKRLAAWAVAAAAATATALAGSLPANATAPAGVYAYDEFRRVSDPGWGAAEAGGSWVTSGGSASDFTLDDTGRATVKVRGAGWHVGASLNGVNEHATEVRTRVSLDARPAAGSVDVDVVTRSTPTDHSYLVRLKFYADGVVRASLVKTTSTGTSTSLNMANVPGLTYADGQVLKVRAQTAGRGGTTHRVKMWPANSPEPADWTVSAVDSAGGLTGGTVGVRAYTSGSVTNLPITVRITGFAAGVPGVTPDAANTAPTAPVTPEPEPTPTAQPRPEIGTYVPDASTTGVPAGTQLTVHHGDLVLDEPGEVLDGKDVHGVVRVTAPGVVIRNSIIRGKPTTGQTALVTSASDAASVTIEDSELYNAYPSGWIDGVRGWNFTLRRVNIHDVIDPAHIYGSNVVIEGSWLHDNIHLENDPAQGGKPSHDDSVQIQVGSNIRIYGNNITGAKNTGIQFTQDRGKVSNVTIEKNHLDGGGCTINLAEKGKGPFQGITIKNNTFGRDTKHYNCAIISPQTTVLTTSGNFFTDGVVANVRKGS